MPENEMLDFVRTMKAKDHVIMFYTDHRQKHLILFTYLKAGLDAGEAAIYIAGEESTDQIRRAMREYGLNAPYYERIRALRIIDYRDWYIVKGEFDISRTMALWQKSFDDALANGFKGLRAAGEMSCFFKHNMIRELVQYERALHRVLEMPLTAICAYDDTVVAKGAQDEYYMRLYLDLIAAHSTILFSGPQEMGVVKTI